MTDSPRPARLPIPFDPACPRQRADGWTIDKQKEFIETLADCGIIREAACRVGMSEQSVSRLRRRPDGAAFSRACEAAIRLARPHLYSIAYERAVRGTIKQHYYHGELKAEERVYDNRLLIYLLGRLDREESGPSIAEIERKWGGIMERVENPIPGTENDVQVWEKDGELWTDFPPPEGFAGLEVGRYGHHGYRRQLSAAESEALDRAEREGSEKWLESEYRRRDRFFGFAGGSGFLGHWEAELSEPSKPEAGSPGAGAE